MKKIGILSLLIFFIIFLSSCNNEDQKRDKKYYQTALVQTGNIQNTNSYIGYTDSFHSIALAPKVGWKIISITKNVWDVVKVWEIIATLDSLEAKTWYASSQDVIKNLEDLKYSTSQMFDSQILVMQEKIKQAQTGIEISNISVKWTETWVWETKETLESQLKTLDKQIESAQTQIESSLLQLENTKNILSQKETDIYSNSKSAINNADILASNIIDFLDNIFWITPANKYKNENFDIYLSARDISLRNKTEKWFNDFMIEFQKIKQFPSETNLEREKKLDIYHEIFSNNLRELLKNSYSALENSVESTSLNQNMLSEYKSKITNFQTQNEQIILSVSGNYFLGLKWSLDSIKNFEKEKKSTLDMLQKQIELAEKQKETLENSKIQIQSAGNTQITDISTKNEISKKQKELSENILRESLAAIESLKKQKDTSLAEIEAQIWQVKSGKNEASVMIENGKITSLIDGIVTKKIGEVGSIIGAGMPILMVSNDQNLKIEISIPQDILEFIKTWDEVKIKIEWVSDMISWNIHNIFPSKDLITKKTSVEIRLPEDKNITIGSYSKVYLSTEKNQSETIIIPNNAIVSKYMIPQVFVLEDNIAKLVHIKILSQNDYFSQIEWLQPWQIIITDGKENVFDGEMLK